jgi:hypothetical protein
MSATKDVDTLLPSQDLPLEFLRLASNSHPGEEPKVAGMLSGMVAARQTDEVICPLMLRRNLIVPAYANGMEDGLWRCV